MKIVALLNKRNLNYINTHNVKKAQCKLTKTYQKEQLE